jgi:DNA methylase
MSLNQKNSQTVKEGASANSLWRGLGRYYATFQQGYAERWILEKTKEDDWVIDPFLGKGSTSFAATSNNRHCIGVEINPVGWVFSKAKDRPAPLIPLIRRVCELGEISKTHSPTTKEEFFLNCYTPRVLSFLETCRQNLNWKEDPIDLTLAAFLMLAMQTSKDQGLSNQMPETKSTGADYATKWWKERGLRPPDVDPVAVVIDKLERRYRLGTPTQTRSLIKLGDSSSILEKMAKSTIYKERCSLLLTSPPYLGVCNYHTDQWLRLWLLGGEEKPVWSNNKHKDRFSKEAEYYQLLHSVFSNCYPLLKQGAHIIVKTDSRKKTLDITRSVLKDIFGKVEEVRDPIKKKTQTELYNSNAKSKDEIELLAKK